jgi:Rap1a immunity proteins
MRSIAHALTMALAFLLTDALANEPAQPAEPAEPAMTTGDLEQLCAGTDHVSRNACRIYILGVTQGINIGLGIAGAKSAKHRPCTPAGISAETLEETVRKRLASMSAPAERKRDAAGFIGTALAAAYPCKQPRAE